MAAVEGEELNLTDFMDLGTLQEIQDNFAAVAKVRATITDAAGNVLTQPQPTREFLQRQNALAAAEEATAGPQREGAEYVAPIMVNNQRLGTLRMSIDGRSAPTIPPPFSFYFCWPTRSHGFATRNISFASGSTS